MTTTSHPLLGVVELGAPGFWMADIRYGARDVSIDLTIDGRDVTAAQIETLVPSVHEIERLDRAARLAILEDARSDPDDDPAAPLYVAHHHSELPSDEYERLFGTGRCDPAIFASALERLVLVRVGLYPESEDRRVLMDYSIDPDATDYLLCVGFDSEGRAVAVDLES
ncbi:MAG: DUF2004 domain-containing protein [Planctomycetota bacterium]